MRHDIGAAKSMRIASRLEQQIKSGVIDRGERLDSENTPMRRFSLSRNTIRKSLDNLSRDGLITKHNGIGSFVDRLRFRMIDGTAISLERARVPWRNGLDSVLTSGLVEGLLSQMLADDDSVIDDVDGILDPGHFGLHVAF